MGNFRDVFDLIFLSHDKRMDKIIHKLIDELEYIELLNEGFQIKSAAKGTFVKLLWSEVVDATYSSQEIIFDTKAQKIVLTQDLLIGWHTFLQGIPTGFPSFDYTALNSFYSNLQGCKCCGLIAVHEQKCACCGFTDWNDALGKEYDSKEEYLKECQLEEFETTNDFDKLEIDNKPKHGFKSDPSWKAVITIDDLEKHCNSVEGEDYLFEKD